MDHPDGSPPKQGPPILTPQEHALLPGGLAASRRAILAHDAVLHPREGPVPRGGRGSGEDVVFPAGSLRAAVGEAYHAARTSGSQWELAALERLEAIRAADAADAHEEPRAEEAPVKRT